MKALCATRPADWWETGDPGNRLALDLCSVCRVLKQCGAGQEFGVIRAGVAWDGHGRRLGVCRCGAPAGNVDRPDCFGCEPSLNTQIPRRRPRRKRTYTPEVFWEVAVRRRNGMSLKEISADMDIPYSTLRDFMKRLRTQASSTGVGGS